MTVERLSGADRAADIAEHLDVLGVVCLPGCVPPDLLESAQTEVRRLSDANNGADFSVVDVQNKPELSLSQIVTDPVLHGLVTQLARIGCPNARGAQDDAYGVLNVSFGRARRPMASRFHYDSNTVAVVIPLIAPDGGSVPSGELALFANHRPFRRSVTVNIVEKLRLVDPWYRRTLCNRVLDPDGGHLHRIRAGDAYVFWGYRSLHAAMAPAAGALRATLVIHCGNPHADSRLLAAVRGVRSALASGIHKWH
ncbi:hypothetical protein [Mycolicibacterium sp. XJ1819]